ncbi:MAG TPA: 50S ribosomal protein L11 methyltransferase [Chromatiaceae bacterium]|jgi:ribosomal protein L11 methyltransferase|nr:50S ribosomal protein L11 methyltransferase [Chromatiaceae bacterium]HIB85495.1 50S ribosomal protein L11 methyltransferase [Chromatiaceae bacterium]
MPWTQVTLNCNEADADRVSAALTLCGALSVTYQNTRSSDVLEPKPDDTPLWSSLSVTGLFDAAVDRDDVQNALTHELPDAIASSLSISTLRDRVWERACLEGLEPMRFGRLWIYPSNQTPPEGDESVIVLDPGLAFGTGTHPTTAQCLEWLGEQPLVGLRVIDYGCGSGILALAAVCLGAASVIAVDYDPQALIATRENAKVNGFSDRITTCLPEQLDNAPVDLVLANILAGPLQELAPRFNKLVNTNGTVVISGLLAEAMNKTCACYQEFFTLTDTRSRDDWMCLSFQKRTTTE